ncbi:MAG: hypothetical protein ACPHL6_08200, partial [Rubripirellula sp.]
MSKQIITSLVIFLALIGKESFAADEELRARNDAIIVRAIERIEGYDFENDEYVMAAISRHMQRVAGTQEFLKLAKKFRPQGIEKQLQAIVLTGKTDNSKADATALLIQNASGKAFLSEAIRSRDITTAADVSRILGVL